LNQTWQPWGKVHLPKTPHKQEFVGGEEGPVGQHPRKTVAHETG